MPFLGLFIVAQWGLGRVFSLKDRPPGGVGRRYYRGYGCYAPLRITKSNLLIDLICLRPYDLRMRLSMVQYQTLLARQHDIGSSHLTARFGPGD